ncbi:MAG TPA: hypothetical protein VHL34_24925 [Rhizomicrobium sp.]|jgi:hypothetical protein|nr:hypothetical protein [Rhizomicrobium sp.]
MKGIIIVLLASLAISAIGINRCLADIDSRLALANCIAFANAGQRCPEAKQ